MPDKVDVWLQKEPRNEEVTASGKKMRRSANGKFLVTRAADVRVDYFKVKSTARTRKMRTNAQVNRYKAKLQKAESELLNMKKLAKKKTSLQKMKKKKALQKMKKELMQLVKNHFQLVKKKAIQKMKTKKAQMQPVKKKLLKKKAMQKMKKKKAQMQLVKKNAKKAQMKKKHTFAC